MKFADIKKWQQLYNEKPAVWAVLDGTEFLGELYDSKEAAELDRDWRKKHTRGHYRIEKLRIQDLSLAKERFGEAR